MPINIIKNVTQQLLPICKDPALAKQEAWWILQTVTHKSKSELLTNAQLTITQEQQDLLDAMVTQRIHEHKPLQYILGTVPFCGLTLHVQPPILIPRPETEEWVTWLVNLYHNTGVTRFTALDLCTGSGCIALALAKNFPQATILGIDINPAAVQLANINKEANSITNCSFITSDLYTKLPAEFTCDLIVSNPPYLAPQEYQQLDLSVKNWEDRNALVAGLDGMMFYHEILRQASRFLRPSKINPTLPNLVLEIGPAQDHQLEQLLQKFNITKYSINKDLQGKPRWLSLFVST